MTGTKTMTENGQLLPRLDHTTTYPESVTCV